MSEIAVLKFRGALLLAQIVLLVQALRTPGALGLILDFASMACLAVNFAIRKG